MFPPHQSVRYPSGAPPTTSADACTWIPTISFRCSRVRLPKRMVSSMRFRNSGRNVRSSSAITLPRALLRSHFLDPPAAGVARHNHDRVRKIHRATVTIGQTALVEQLQQDVEDLHMRLLDLIQQQHAVRTTAHRLGQLSALIVANVARRRTDQARDRVLFLVLAHINAHHRLLGIKEEFGQRARQLRLPNAGRPQEQERPDRPVGGLQPRASAAHGIGDGAHRLVLTDDALVQLVLHPHQLLALTLHQPRNRDARPVRDDTRDLLRADLLVQQRVYRPGLVPAAPRRLPHRAPSCCILP